MNIEPVSGFHAIGHEARTSNAKEMTGEGAIGRMWSVHKPNGEPILAVYSEYASDKDGEYSYLLGLRGDEEDTLPIGTVRRRVEAGQYLRLEHSGEVKPETIVELWRQIWAMEGTGAIQRAYKTDFERYSATGVELFVGVK